MTAKILGCSEGLLPTVFAMLLSSDSTFLKQPNKGWESHNELPNKGWEPYNELSILLKVEVEVDLQPTYGRPSLMCCSLVFGIVVINVVGGISISISISIIIIIIIIIISSSIIIIIIISSSSSIIIIIIIIIIIVVIIRYYKSILYRS